MRVAELGVGAGYMWVCCEACADPAWPSEGWHSERPGCIQNRAFLGLVLHQPRGEAAGPEGELDLGCRPLCPAPLGPS